MNEVTILYPCLFVTARQSVPESPAAEVQQRLGSELTFSI